MLDLDETFTEAQDVCCLKSNHTKPYQSKLEETKTTLSLLQNSQNKSDLDETYTVPLDGYCFKPNQTNSKTS